MNDSNNIILKVAYVTDPNGDCEMYRVRCSQPNTLLQLTNEIEAILPWAKFDSATLKARNAEGVWSPLTCDQDLSAAITTDGADRKLIVQVSSAEAVAKSSATSVTRSSSPDSADGTHAETAESAQTGESKPCRRAAQRSNVTVRRGGLRRFKCGYLLIILFALLQVGIVCKIGRALHASRDSRDSDAPVGRQLDALAQQVDFLRQSDALIKQHLAERSWTDAQVADVLNQQREWMSSNKVGLERAVGALSRQSAENTATLTRLVQETQALRQAHPVVVNDVQTHHATLQRLLEHQRAQDAQLQHLYNFLAHHEHASITSEQQQQQKQQQALQADRDPDSLMETLGETAKLVKQLVNEQWKEVPTDKIKSLLKSTYQSVKHELTEATRQLNAVLTDSQQPTEQRKTEERKPIVQVMEHTDDDDDDNNNLSRKNHQHSSQKRSMDHRNSKNDNSLKRKNIIDEESAKARKRMNSLLQDPAGRASSFAYSGSGHAHAHAHSGKQPRQPWWKRHHEL